MKQSVLIFLLKQLAIGIIPLIAVNRWKMSRFWNASNLIHFASLTRRIKSSKHQNCRLFHFVVRCHGIGNVIDDRFPPPCQFYKMLVPFLNLTVDLHLIRVSVRRRKFSRFSCFTLFFFIFHCGFGVFYLVLIGTLQTSLNPSVRVLVRFQVSNAAWKAFKLMISSK